MKKSLFLASLGSYLYIFILVYDVFLFFIFIYLIFLILLFTINVISEVGVTLRFRKHFLFGQEHKIFFQKLSANHLNVILKYIKRVAKKELSLMSWFFIILRWVFLITPIYWTFMLFFLWFRFQLLHIIYLFEKFFAIKFKFLVRLVFFLNNLGKWHNSVIRFKKKFKILNFFILFLKKIKFIWRKIYIYFWWQRVYWRKFFNIVYRKLWKFIRFLYVEQNFIFSLLWWFRFFFLYFYFYFLLSLDFLSYGYYWFKIKFSCFRFFYLTFYLHPKFLIMYLRNYLNIWRIFFLLWWFRFYFYFLNFIFFLFFRVKYLKNLFNISIFFKYLKLDFSHFDWFKFWCKCKINWYRLISKIKFILFLLIFRM